jgi:hypothetical protein
MAKETTFRQLSQQIEHQIRELADAYSYQSDIVRQVNQSLNTLLEIQEKASKSAGMTTVITKKYRAATKKMVQTAKELEKINKTHSDITADSGKIHESLEKIGQNYDATVEETGRMSIRLKDITGYLALIGESESLKNIPSTLEELDKSLSNIVKRFKEKEKKETQDAAIPTAEEEHKAPSAHPGEPDLEEQKKRKTESIISKSHKERMEREKRAIPFKATQSVLSTGLNMFMEYAKTDDSLASLNAIFAMKRPQLAEWKSAITATQIAVRQYGTTLEDVVKMQSAYAEETGRAIQLSLKEFEMMSQISRIVGSPEAAAKFAGELDRFGMSSINATRYMRNILQEAAKGGVNARAAVNSVQNGLKLAQSYTFRDGLDGLKRMSVYAMQTRLNMQQVASFADKVGTLEGAVETSANLQVLGGSFAALSHPLEMLYNATNDFESLGKQLNSMFSQNLFMNWEKGIVDATSIDKQRFRQAATHAGVDYNEMFTAASTTKMREEIEKRTSWESLRRSSGFNEGELHDDIKNLLASNAHFNQSKKAVVTVLSEKEDVKSGIADKEGQLIEKEIEKLTRKQLNYIIDRNSDIRDVAISTKGMATDLRLIKTFLVDEVSALIHKFMASGFGQKVYSGASRAVSYLSENPNMGLAGILTGAAALGYTKLLFSKLKHNYIWGGEKPSGGFLSRSGRAGGAGGSAARGAAGGIGKVSFNAIGKSLGVAGALAGGAITFLEENRKGNFRKDSGHRGEAIGKTGGIVAGTLAGAKAGAAIGALFGGWGAIPGALIGSIGGAFLGEKFGGAAGSMFDKSKSRNAVSTSSVQRPDTAEQEYGVFGNIARSGEENTLHLKSIARSTYMIENTLKNMPSTLSAQNTNSRGSTGKNTVFQGYSSNTPAGYTSVNDLRIKPDGTSSIIQKGNQTYRTNPADEVTALRPVKEKNSAGRQIEVQRISVPSPSKTGFGERQSFEVNINLNGAIKLESKGREIDISKDPVLIGKLTDLVSESINSKNYQGKAKFNLNQRIGYYYNQQ